MFGFLNIYKPTGMTSHDVVSYLRKILKIKQIGHTGTLDPFAEGVLPICIGKSTRLIEYLNDDKAYIGTIKFGEKTTTYDLEGEVVETSQKIPSFEEFEACLNKFQGQISQKPPIYSAIKLKGKKLYEYAREGLNPEIKEREVFIEKIAVLGFDELNKTAEIYISCSKGTYIRSIANDIGEDLGCYAHLIKLIRVKAGKFLVQDSVKLEDIKSIEDAANNIKNPIEYLDYPTYGLDETQISKVLNGNPININLESGKCILIYDNKITAIADINNGIAKIIKVFPT